MPLNGGLPRLPSYHVLPAAAALKSTYRSSLAHCASAFAHTWVYDETVLKTRERSKADAGSSGTGAKSGRTRAGCLDDGRPIPGDSSLFEEEGLERRIAHRRSESPREGGNCCATGRSRFAHRSRSTRDEARGEEARSHCSSCRVRRPNLIGIRLRSFAVGHGATLPEHSWCRIRTND